MGLGFSAFRMENNRAFAPHCDSSILHAPGACIHCDKYPDWQSYRELARIAFTGQDEQGTKDLSPCPSTHFRSPDQRDLWGGNVAKKKEEKEGFFRSLFF